MKIGWASCFLPVRSGLAYYSSKFASFLNELGTVLNIDTQSVTFSKAIAVAEKCDIVFYNVGNDPQTNANTYKLALKIPGIPILHEFVLTDLVLSMCTNYNDTVASLWYSAGELGKRVAREYLETGTIDKFIFPLFERVVDSNLATVVHSEYAKKRILLSRPNCKVAVVPHPVLKTCPTKSEENLIGIFGWISPYKKVELALEAFQQVKDKIGAKLILAGEIVSKSWFLSLKEKGLLKDVTITGWIDDDTFNKLLSKVKVGIVLRHPTGGEASGITLELMSRGKVVIVNDSGWFSELPRDVVVHIDPGEGELERLKGAICTLLSNRKLICSIGTNALDYVREFHSVSKWVKGIEKAISLAIEKRTPFTPTPPLVHFTEDDLLPKLARELGKSVVDLGIGNDSEVIDALVETVNWFNGSVENSNPGF